MQTVTTSCFAIYRILKRCSGRMRNYLTRVKGECTLGYFEPMKIMATPFHS